MLRLALARVSKWCVWALAAAVVFAAAFTPRTNAADEPGLLISAAASTTDAVEEICEAFRKRHPGTAVRTSFGASSALAKQIEAGARADLFLSASDDWADLLAEKDLVDRRCELLGNRLVVIVAADSSLKIQQPDDLLDNQIQRLALADPVSVPAGVYAREALQSLGLWDRVEPRVAAGADVRQALKFVSTGAAEAGIVYASDAASDPAVRIAYEFAPELSAGIRYPLVLIKHPEPHPAAAELYEFFTSSEAADIFRTHGFITLAKQTETPPAAVGQQGANERCSRRWWVLSSEEWSALRLSALVGVCAVLMSLPAAIALGYYLARSNGRGKWLVELLVNLPLVLPPVVTGYLLLMLFAPRGPIGGVLEAWFSVRIVFTWFAAAIAAAVVSFPLLVRAIRLSFQAIDPRLEAAARTLGARRWDAFSSVSLPLARTGVLAGVFLAFARSLGEFGATIMVAGNIVGQTQTIPLAIFSQANRPGAQAELEVWRLVLISIMMAALALIVSEWLERRHAARESA